MESVFNVEVSCFKNYDTPANPKPINLIKWLTSPKYQEKVNLIRTIEDKKERDSLKAELPAITPSGLFSYRKKDSLIRHSGLIQFDIDLTDKNSEIENWDDLKKQIFKIQHVAYIGLSVSGKGYWGLIPISEPAQHKGHFKAIERMFAKFGIKLDDAPSNVASLRGYSYDPDAYFRHDAKVFTKTIKDTPRPATYSGNIQINGSIEGLLRRMIINAGDGEKHFCLNNAAYLAGGYIAGGQLDEHKAIDILTNEIQAKENVRSLDAAIRTIQKSIADGKNKPLYFDSYDQPATEIIRTPPPRPEPPKKAVNETLQKYFEIERPPEPIKTENWDADIAELETYFESIKLPEHPIKIDQCSTILDCSKYIDTNLSTAKTNNGKRTFLPYLDRLKELRAYMQAGKHLETAINV